MLKFTATKMLEIDGSYLEGGGQIFRNALSLSCILGRPVCITKIRSNRPNPGLNHQQLHCLHLLQQLTSANVSGDHLTSSQVSFTPHAIKCGTYSAIASTAASISLMLQCALPVVAFADGPTSLKLGGGTNVGMAPPIEYMTEIVRPLQEQFGVSYDFTLLRRGYYPQGGGLCEIRIEEPVPKLKAICLTEFGKIREIGGWCYVAGKVIEHLAVKMKNSAENVLRQYQDISDIMAYKETRKIAPCNGSGLTLFAATTSGCLLGSSALSSFKQSNPNDMGQAAAKELLAYLEDKTCVDRWAQDQLIIFMALAEGESRIKTCNLTDHTRTAIHVAELMTGVKFTILSQANGVIISCHGKGVINHNFKSS